MENSNFNNATNTMAHSDEDNQRFWNGALESQSQEQEAQRLLKNGRGNQFINHQRLPQGEHHVRFIVDPLQKLFHNWETVYIPNHRREANVCNFEDCPKDIRERITNARKKPGFPWKNDFWKQFYAYMYVEETSVDNKYFLPGRVYVVSMSTEVKDSLLKNFTRLFELEGDALSDSFMLSKDAPGIKLTIGDSVHADLDTRTIIESPEFNIRMRNFVPLSQLWQYDSSEAHDMARYFESVASKL